VNFSAIDQTIMAVQQAAIQQFNDQAGNIDMLGGLSPSSDTVGQDQLLSQGANGRVESMRDIVYHATRRVMEQFAWYVWNDPIRTYRGSRNVPGTEISIPIELTPDDREGKFSGMNVKIIPGSMQRKSAEQRLNEVLQIVTQVLPAINPAMIDVSALMALISRYKQLPELLQVIMTDPSPLELPADVDGMPKPAVTNRTTTRRSVAAGPTGQARSHSMMQSLLAAGAKPSEQTV
jgi:hypothetical protein